MGSSLENDYKYLFDPYMELTDTTTPGQSEPGSNGNESILHIPQNSRTGASLSNGLVSYLGHLLKVSGASAGMHLAYSTAPANWTSSFGIK